MKISIIKNTYNKFFSFIAVIIIIVIISFVTCKTPEFNYQYVKYDNEKYLPTKHTEITYYANRLQINQKYKEIGVIKFEGKFYKDKAIEIAAKHGANAILIEANNIVLIRYQNPIYYEKN